jgi:hypothetical protein
VTRTPHLVLVALAVSTISLAGCGGGGPECGAGTIEVDGECVPDDPLSCGDGTVEQDGVCIPVADVAPTISAIDPIVDLVGGGADFTITGTGFQAENAGTTVVMFGTVAVTATVDSDTQLSGTVPAAVAPTVAVTVLNDNGSDDLTDGFSYTGIYAADGGGGFGGNLYLLDPRDGTSVIVGPIMSDADTAHGVTGMVFDDSGTLYATEATFAESRGAASNLLTIDPADGSATVVGALEDCCVPAITISGTDLLGWSRTTDDLVTIDTSTGAVTASGGDNASAFGGGMVTLGDGTVLLAGDGLGGVGGDVFSVDPTDGTLSASPVFTMDGAARDAVAALTRHQGVVYGVSHSGNAASLFSVDTTDGTVTVLGRVPGGIDALASNDPDPAASTARRPARARAVTAMEAPTAPPACADQPGLARITLFGAQRSTLAAGSFAGRTDTVAVAGKRPGMRGVTVTAAFGDLHGATTIEAIPCDGTPMVLPVAELARFALTPNARGQLKLVDARGGRTLLRNVIELRAF